MHTTTAPIAPRTPVTAGTKTVHLVSGQHNGGTYYPPCSASFSGKDVKPVDGPVTCRVCAKYVR